jgi:DNA-binding transcriptional MerR regulator
MTIDELARVSGVTTRNIRAYGSRGLLAPPTLAGRVGHYGPEHLARLRLIARLQERGYSLAAVADVLESWSTGKAFHQMLGLEQGLTEPFSAVEPRPVTAAELESLVPTLTKDRGLVDRAIELELLERDGSGYRLLNEPLLRVGQHLIEAGVSAPAGLDALATLRPLLEPIAQAFVGLFLTHIWRPFVAAGSPPEQLDEVIRSLERMRSVTFAAIQAAFGQVMDKEVGAVVARELGAEIPILPLAAGRSSRGRG